MNDNSTPNLDEIARRGRHWDELLKTECHPCGLNHTSGTQCQEWQEQLRRVRERAKRLCGI